MLACPRHSWAFLSPHLPEFPLLPALRSGLLGKGGSRERDWCWSQQGQRPSRMFGFQLVTPTPPCFVYFFGVFVSVQLKPGWELSEAALTSLMEMSDGWAKG